MFGILGFILILLLVIVLFAFALLGNLLRFVFGLGKRTPKYYNNQTSSNKNNEEYVSESVTQNKTERKKIFDKDDGEYVEFEEIK